MVDQKQASQNLSSPPTDQVKSSSQPEPPNTWRNLIALIFVTGFLMLAFVGAVLLKSVVY